MGLKADSFMQTYIHPKFELYNKAGIFEIVYLYPEIIFIINQIAK